MNVRNARIVSQRVRARAGALRPTIGAVTSTVFLAGVASVVACGSSSSSSPPTETDDLALVGGAPCSIHSGWAGDDMCITAPQPAYGAQFHYGPAAYTEAEIAPYLLQPGDEDTDCTFFMLPNTTTVYFNQYHSRMRPGSHHMLLYTQPPGGVTETTPDSGPDENCNQGLQTRNLFGATTPTLDVDQFDGAPENDGLAVEIPAKQQGVMQAHFINVGTAPLLREVWANIVYTDKSNVKTLGDPIFFLAGLGMSVAEGTKTTIHGTATVPTNAADHFRLVVATPHFHTHLTRFDVTATIGGTTTNILEQWPVINTVTDPIIRWYDSVTTNPTIDTSAQLNGAYSGDIYMKPGDTIDWYCDVYNDNEPNPLTFAEHVYTGEMCNLFGLYAPTTGGPWYAYNF